LRRFHRRRLMRSTVFCPSRLRHFRERPSVSVVIFFRATIALGIEQLRHRFEAG